MRNGGLIGGTQFAAHTQQVGYDIPVEAPAHNSADLLERTANKVERTVNGLQDLLDMIAGPRNQATGKLEPSPPHAVPVLSRMLEQAPAQIAIQCDRAEQIMGEIRQALGL